MLTKWDRQLIAQHKTRYERLVSGRYQPQSQNERHFVKTFRYSLEPVTQHEIAYSRYLQERRNKFFDEIKEGKEQKLHRIRGNPSFAPKSIDPGTNINSDVSSFILKAIDSIPSTNGGIYLWRDAKGKDEFDYKYTVMELQGAPQYTRTSGDRSHNVPKRISITRKSRPVSPQVPFAPQRNKRDFLKTTTPQKGV